MSKKELEEMLAALEQVNRENDTPEKLTKRLSEYEAAKAAIVHYREKGLVTELDGEQAPDVVYGQLKKAVGK